MTFTFDFLKFGVTTRRSRSHIENHARACTAVDQLDTSQASSSIMICHQSDDHTGISNARLSVVWVRVLRTRFFTIIFAEREAQPGTFVIQRFHEHKGTCAPMMNELLQTTSHIILNESNVSRGDHIRTSADLSEYGFDVWRYIAYRQPH